MAGTRARPKAEPMVKLPLFPGSHTRQVELAAGYEFGTPKGRKVDVINKRTQEKNATLECHCQGGGGNCTLTVINKVATCLNNSCKACGFVVTVPQGAFAEYLGDVFRR